jgi:hypothetical protein
VFAARYELNSYIVFRKRLVSRRLMVCWCVACSSHSVLPIGTLSTVGEVRCKATMNRRWTSQKLTYTDFAVGTTELIVTPSMYL